MTVKIDDIGSIQIPAEMLDKLKICINDILKIALDSKNNCIVITKKD